VCCNSHRRVNGTAIGGDFNMKLRTIYIYFSFAIERLFYAISSTFSSDSLKPISPS